MAKANTADMRQTLSRLAIASGVVSILFGLFALVWPGLTIVTLGVLLAIWLLVGGAVGMVTSIVSRNNTEHWVFQLVLSFLELGVGAYLVQRPGVTVATMVALVAIVLVARGVIDVVMALVDSKAEHRVFSAIVGVLGLVAGILVWRYPVSGGLAFVWVLGLYALVYGALSIASGVEVDG
jgi:uncharacterized membrane protein HdeD (DUF308 family)